jgi:hypothetical protein
VARPHAAIYRIVNFRRPCLRVYRDEKRVFHDILDNQWNLSGLRWSIRFSDFHTDGTDRFENNSKNLFDVDVSARELRFGQLWFWTETQSVHDRRVQMITVVDIIPDLHPERPSGSAAYLAANETHNIVHILVLTNTKSPFLVALVSVGARLNSD